MEDYGLLDVDKDEDLYTLHYVFMPRINSQLAQFSSAWNQHPLRTENGLSPLQLWTRGLLSSPVEWQNEISSGLMMNEELYGAETYEDAFSSCFDRVDIRFDFSLTQQQMQYLRDNYNPLQYSDNNGIDIYIDVKMYIESL